MLTCREFAELYDGYRTKQLPYSQRMGVFMHKTMCKHCKHYVKQINIIVDVSKEIRKIDKFECKDDLRAKLRAAYKTKYSA